MASRSFGAPVSAMPLTGRDRRFFKSQAGAGWREFPRLRASCAEVARRAAPA